MSDTALAIVLEALKASDARNQAQFTELRQDFAGLGQNLAGLRQDFTGLGQDFAGLRQEFGGLRQEFGGLRQELITVRSDLMDRIDRLQDRTLALHDDLIVAMGTSNHALLFAKNARAEGLSMQEQISSLVHKLRTIDGRLDRLEDRA